MFVCKEFFSSSALLNLQPTDAHLEVFSELLGVPCEEMAHWLCHKKIKTAAETYVKPVPKMNAVNGRDALAKHIYARLFSWIVDSINSALRSAVKQHSFIGVLDIYGLVSLSRFAVLTLSYQPTCFHFSHTLPFFF